MTADSEGDIMTSQLEGRRVAFLVANEGVEQIELTAPWKAVEDAGGTPTLIAIEAGTAQAYNHLDRADTFAVDMTVADAQVQSFDALVLPGGVANPDRLRMEPKAVHFVRSFFDAGKPVAVICHGPWTLIEAGAVRDRTLTSWPSLRTDLTNAGAEWIDTPVHVDTNGPNVLVSSRKPDDLAAFNAQLVETFATAPAHA
jgi:protease I